MAESARLSPLQQETIIKLRDLYLRNVGILARRRQRLTAVLQVRWGCRMRCRTAAAHCACVGLEGQLHVDLRKLDKQQGRR